MILDKKSVRQYFLFLVSCLLFFLLAQPYPEFYERRHLVCIKLIEEGTLYNLQPYCTDAPLTFHLAYLIHLFVGDDLLQISFRLLYAVVATLIVFLIYRIISLEASTTNEKKKWLTAVLCILFVLAWVYYSSLGLASPETILATFFLLCGVYFLFYSTHTYYHMCAYLFFGLSFLSKVTTVPSIVLAIMFYVFHSSFRKGEFGEFHFKTHVWKQLCLGGILFILVVGVFFVRYPHLTDYMFSARGDSSLSLGERLSRIADLPQINGRYVFVGWFLVFQYIILKAFFSEKILRRKFFYAAGGMLWLFQWYLVAYKYGEGPPGISALFERYNIILLPFSIISLFLLRQLFSRAKSWLKIAFSIFFCASLLLPLIQTFGHNRLLDLTIDRSLVQEVDGFAAVLNNALTAVPFEPNTTILFSVIYPGQSNEFFDGEHISFKVEELVMEDDFSPTDRSVVAYFQKKYGINYSLIHPSSLSPHFHTAVHNLKNHSYPAYIAFLGNQYKLPNYIHEQSLALQDYCSVLFFTMDLGNQGYVVHPIFFRNSSLCYLAAQNISHYYLANYEEICYQSYLSARLSSSFIRQSQDVGITRLEPKCYYTNELVRRYHSRPYNRIDGYLIAIIATASVLRFYWRRKSGRARAASKHI